MIPSPRETTPQSLPSDLAAAHAMILAERAARVQAEAAHWRRDAATAEAEAANAQADLSSREALIAHLKLEIEKLRRSALRHSLGAQGAAAGADGAAAGGPGGRPRPRTSWRREKAAAQTQTVRSFERRRPSRKPFPEHLPRERVVIAAPEKLSLLRIDEAVEAGRGHHRDAGGDPAPVEGDPDGAREVLVPGLRDDHAAAGALPCDAARLRRARTCWP